MTDIEKKALALVNEVEGGNWLPHETDRIRNFATICRAIEQHEAFKREVSDAVGHYLDQWRHSTPSREVFACQFGDFIIAKPDPLVEALNDLYPETSGNREYAEKLRTALAARGGRIVWEGE